MKPLEEIKDILGAQLTCIHTSENGIYQVFLTATQVERLREILDNPKEEEKEVKK